MHTRKQLLLFHSVFNINKKVGKRESTLGVKWVTFIGMLNLNS